MDSERHVLAGRYWLGQMIGQGGMGTVYRATDLILGRTVAVKVLPGLLAEQDPVRVSRFEREARIAARLVHPSVVSVYDMGVDQHCRFIVMEYLDGRSLAAIVHAEAPLGPVRAVRIASAVADGLAAAHAAGVIHRDVKPANVMVSTEGSIKILDFGLARLLEQSALTESAMALGTAPYMAPEQALGERVDERSDVYSLGCLLYAMLTGRPPFTADSAPAIIHQQIHREPAPPSATNRRVSRSLDALVEQMLAKAPDARPQSAADVRELLGLEHASTPRRAATAADARSAPRASEATASKGDQTFTRAGSAPTRERKSAATRATLPAKARRGRVAVTAQLTAVAGLIALVVLYTLGSPHPAHRRRGALRQSTRAALSTRSRASMSSPGPAGYGLPAPRAGGSGQPSTPPPSAPGKAPSRGQDAGDEGGGEAPETPAAGGEPPGQAKKHRAAGPAAGEAQGERGEPPGQAKKHGADGEGGEPPGQAKKHGPDGGGD